MELLMETISRFEKWIDRTWGWFFTNGNKKF